MTPTTPKQARAMARLCFTDNRNALWSLADQVEALTKERDEFKQRMQKLMSTVTELKVERDALAAAAKMALEALEHVQWNNWRTDKAIKALRQAGVQ